MHSTITVVYEFSHGYQIGSRGLEETEDDRQRNKPGQEQVRRNAQQPNRACAVRAMDDRQAHELNGAG